MNSDKFSLRSRFESFKFAFRGLWFLFKEEHNARIHFIAAVVAIALGILLKIEIREWSLLAVVIGLVIITELVNTAIETLSDIIDPEWNAKIMKAKDYAAAAVLISAVVSVVIAGLIFIPKILDLI